MGAEAQQMLRLRASVQYNLHGMHAGSKHVENPGETWRAIILRHLHVCCKHRMEGSHVQTLYEHAQAYDESQHLPNFNCDAYVSPRSQQARENELKKKLYSPDPCADLHHMHLRNMETVTCLHGVAGVRRSCADREADWMALHLHNPACCGLAPRLHFQI